MHDSDESVTIGDQSDANETYLRIKDKMAIEIFGAIVLGAGFLYGWVYGGWFVSGYALLSCVMLWLYPRSGDYDPLFIEHKFYNGLQEVAIIILVFYNSVILLGILLEPVGGLAAFLIPLITSSLFCLFFMIPIRKYSVRSLGFTREGFHSGKMWLAAYVLSGVAIAVVRLIVDFSNVIISNFNQLIWAVMLSFLLFGLAVGFAEELVFRAVVQPRLSSYLGSRIGGIAMTALMFAVMHVFLVSGLTYSASPDILCAILAATLTRLPIAVFLGITWDMTRNLIAPISVNVVTNTIVYTLVAASFLGGG